jgi:hypothetical protein
MKRFALAIAVAAVCALTPVAWAAGIPNGTYKTTIKSSKPFRGALNGTWTLKIKGANYRVFFKHKLQDKGVALIAGNVISLKDTAGPGACKGAGTYKWTLMGKKLKFTKVSDPDPTCAGRRFVLKHTFTKVS